MPAQSWDPNAGQSQRSVAKRFFTKRMIIMLSVVGAILFLIFGYIFGMRMIIAGFMKNMSQEQSVSTVHPVASVWQGDISAVGSLHAVEGADLAPEVAGLVTKIGFTAGQDVKKGALLVQLRDDAERAAADQAMTAYKRAVQLLKNNAISQSDYDTAEANMRSTKAALEKKSIRAPFSGRVGIRQVDVGAYVGAGTVLVTLQQLDPIYVDFTVSQQDMPRLKVGSKVSLTTDTFPGKSFVGDVTAFDPKVDEATRTVRVRAVVRNGTKALLPGMFATVHIDTGSPKSYLTLPQTAITYSPYGDTVYLVQKGTVKDKPALVAQQRFVTIGSTRGDQVAIVSGVSAQDEVVSAGQVKLKSGTPVKVNNAVHLPNDPAPTPVQK